MKAMKRLMALIIVGVIATALVVRMQNQAIQDKDAFYAQEINKKVILEKEVIGNGMIRFLLADHKVIEIPAGALDMSNANVDLYVYVQKGDTILKGANSNVINIKRQKTSEVFKITW